MARKASNAGKDAPGIITIKKYANRRLYNTAASSYVTLDDLATMVRDGIEFLVYDAKTNEDITRAVLTQIIVEQEAKGNNLLPTGFLRQLNHDLIANKVYWKFLLLQTEIDAYRVLGLKLLLILYLVFL